jgi:hypothetical protein
MRSLSTSFHRSQHRTRARVCLLARALRSAAIQYNRTAEISRLTNELGSIACGTSPYSVTAYEVDQALRAVEAQLAGSPSRASGDVPAAADPASKKQKSKTGTLVAVVTLSLLLLAAAILVAHRRRQSGTRAVPTAAAMSNLTVAQGHVGYAGYDNLMHTAAVVGSGVTGAISNVGYVGADDTGEEPTHAASGASEAVPVKLGSDVSTLYAIPFAEGDGGGVLANGHGLIENPAYEYLEVGSSV